MFAQLSTPLSQLHNSRDLPWSDLLSWAVAGKLIYCLALGGDRTGAVIFECLEVCGQSLLRTAAGTRDLYKDARQKNEKTLLVNTINTVNSSSVLADNPPSLLTCLEVCFNISTAYSTKKDLCSNFHLISEGKMVAEITPSLRYDVISSNAQVSSIFISFFAAPQ